MRNLPGVIEFFDARNEALEELATRIEYLAKELCGDEGQEGGSDRLTAMSEHPMLYSILGNFEGRFERQTAAIDRIAYSLGRLDSAISNGPKDPARSLRG